MKHARQDYDRIQDPSNKIPEHEPVFLLRGQDKLMIPMLNYYKRIAKKAGVRPDMIEAIDKQIRRVEVWQDDVKVKLPDLPVNGVPDKN